MADPKAEEFGIQVAISFNEYDGLTLAGNRKKNCNFVIMDSDNDLEKEQDLSVNIQLLYAAQDGIYSFISSY